MDRVFAAVLVVAAVVLCVGQPTTATAADYLIDRDHTEVRVTWDHFGLTRQSAEFRDVIGRLSFEPERPQEARIDVTIKIASIASGVAALDRQLTGTRDFFNAAQFPDATFKSTAVTPLGQTTANVTGDLTINGITKPITLSVVWNFTGAHPLAAINPVYSGVVVSAFSARAKLQRSDFGMTRALPLVSDDIVIEIETELIQKIGAPAANTTLSPSLQAPPAPGNAPEHAVTPTPDPSPAPGGNN